MKINEGCGEIKKSITKCLFQVLEKCYVSIKL